MSFFEILDRLYSACKLTDHARRERISRARLRAEHRKGLASDGRVH